MGVAADGAASLPGDTSLAGSEGPIGQQANTDGVTLGSSATDDGAGGITGASGSEPALGVAEPSELGSSGSQLGGSADRYASGGEASTPGSAVGSKGASGENDQQASAPGSSATGSSSRGTSSVGAGQMASIAEPQGSTGPAPTGPQRSVPIRRTIHIVVRRDHVALLPSRHETHGVGATGIEISLNQSRGQIAEKINIALRNRMKDWGLAGSGLVWRPVLQLNVGPDAGRSAIEVERLLRGSGVEVRILETAQQETDHELR